MLRRNILSLAMMCSKKPVADWQYMADINKYLKEGDHNSAVSTLIKSNLSNTVLDMQTYKNMHDGLIGLGISISYHQVVYKLYRQTFQPNQIMVDLMNHLLHTKSSKLMHMLKKDYEALNIQMPQKKQKQKPSVTHPQKLKPKKQFIQQTTNIDSEEKNELQPEQIRRVLQALLGSYSKVVVHDVEILCNNNFEDQYNSEDYDEADEEEGYDEMDGEELLENVTSSISKIKIGRIQIFDSRKPEDPNDHY